MKKYKIGDKIHDRTEYRKHCFSSKEVEDILKIGDTVILCYFNKLLKVQFKGYKKCNNSNSSGACRICKGQKIFSNIKCSVCCFLGKYSDVYKIINGDFFSDKDFLL